MDVKTSERQTMLELKPVSSGCAGALTVSPKTTSGQAGQGRG